jgi:hypothetical protein
MALSTCPLGHRQSGQRRLELDRRARHVQTSQAFSPPCCEPRDPVSANGTSHDCAALVEAAGRVTTVAGDERLLKITTQADLERVAGWLSVVAFDVGETLIDETRMWSAQLTSRASPGSPDGRVAARRARRPSRHWRSASSTRLRRGNTTGTSTRCP